MEADQTDDQPTTKVSFKIMSPMLIPDEISQILQIVPDRSHKKGDFPRNDPKYSPYKKGMWSLDSRCSEYEPLSKHLEMLLVVLLPKQEIIVEIARDSHIYFYCSLFSQSDFYLENNLLMKITSLKASLGVSTYP